MPSDDFCAGSVLAAPAALLDVSLPAQAVSSYRQPYDLAGVLRFLTRRAMSDVETIEGLEWRRTLAVEQDARRHRGWVCCRFDPARAQVLVTVAPSLLPVLAEVLMRVRRGLDLDADPAQIDAALLSLPGPARAGVRVPGAVDGFETAARIVLGQQVSVAAARTLAERLVEAFGEALETPFAGLRRLFPSAGAIAAADPQRIAGLGIVRQRVRALQALAEQVHAGRIALHPAAPQATLDALRALPGIGEWTVQLIAMRVLAQPDAFAATDVAMLNALRTRDARVAIARAEAWRPWRAYALMRLWQSQESTP